MNQGYSGQDGGRKIKPEEGKDTDLPAVRAVSSTMINSLGDDVNVSFVKGTVQSARDAGDGLIPDHE